MLKMHAIRLNGLADLADCTAIFEH